MNISCAKRCRIEEFLGNLKCPNCFSVKPKSKTEKGGLEENTEFQDCQCQVEMRSENLRYWE